MFSNVLWRLGKLFCKKNQYEAVFSWSLSGIRKEQTFLQKESVWGGTSTGFSIFPPAGQTFLQKESVWGGSLPIFSSFPAWRKLFCKKNQYEAAGLLKHNPPGAQANFSAKRISMRRQYQQNKSTNIKCKLFCKKNQYEANIAGNFNNLIHTLPINDNRQRNLEILNTGWHFLIKFLFFLQNVLLK